MLTQILDTHPEKNICEKSLGNQAIESSSSKPDDSIQFPIGKFMKFLKKLKIQKLLSSIQDSRDPSKVQYKKETMLMWALSIFFFEQDLSTSCRQPLTNYQPYEEKRSGSILNYLLKANSLIERA